MPTVLNKRTATAAELEGAVYVGRPTKWGNPFKIGDRWGAVRLATREDVVRYYSVYINHERTDLRDDAKLELRGKNLVCWCAPLQCHADVLLEIANDGA